jgi:nitroreductase
MSAIDAIYTRRAVRNYLPRRVESELIHALLTAAVQAPTAMHEEPWLFAIVQERAQLARYSERAKAMMLGETATHPLVRGAAGEGHRALLSEPGFNIFYDASTLVVIAGAGAGAFVAADCWLAAENLMLAATAMGLASCPIGFAVSMLNTADVKADLQIPADASLIAPIIIGYRNGDIPTVARKAPSITYWG